MTENWKFKQLQKSDKMVDPFQTQFFTTEIVGGITSALVRETIQNSLDAKNNNSGDSPVVVRFFLSGKSKALSPKNADRYFDGLKKHLFTKSNGLQKSKLPNFKESVPYLIVEDFGTVGLEGNPLEFEDPPSDSQEKHNFYWFWRNVGRSGKKHDERGRWGLGKAVYPKSSYIHTYFGMTHRKSDNRQLLMGESILSIHKLEGESKNSSPYGYFGNFDDQDEFFVSPIEEKQRISDFKKDFYLNRNNDENRKYGLSLSIPFPSEEITKSELIKSVVMQYFHPIISEQLEVMVEDADSDFKMMVKDNNIEAIIDEIDFSDEEQLSAGQLQNLIKFSRWAIQNKDFLELNKPNPKKSPAWRIDDFFGEDNLETLEKYRELFDNGERVAFEVPVKYQKENGAAEIRTFKVYFEKDDSLKETDCHFIRDGITILGVKPLKKRGIRALVIIDDQLLSNLLGDSENPAHTEWSKDSRNFVGKYKHGDKVISFVTNSLDRLYTYLLKPSGGLDKDILEDFFYVEDSEKRSDGSGSKKGGDKPDRPDPPGEGTQYPLIVSQIPNGIKIKSNDNTDKSIENLNLQLAYMAARGNPFKKYNKLDFNLNNPEINIKVKNLQIMDKDLNFIHFKVNHKNFEAEITGFDTTRDLIIKTDD